MSYLGQQLGQGQAARFVYTASGGETSVTTSNDGRAVAYTVGQVDVYLNGAKLINGSDFTATTGTSITGLAALTASDVVEVFALSIFQASDTVSAASGGTFNGNVTMAANLSFGDNNKAIFGAGSDLQIYHDGFHSNIKETGAGSLIVDAANTIFRNADATKSYAVMTDGGSVDLYYNNALKLATTNTGIDVTGTVTADGLTVEGTNGNFEVATTGNSVNMTRAGNNFITASDAVGDLFLGAGGVSFVKIDNGGDISFYEDTGTTAKFFWDASAESLGIGTTSPSSYPVASDLVIDTGTNGGITIKSGTTNYGGLFFADGTTGNEQYRGFVQYNHNYVGSVDALLFGTAGTEKMRIDSSGNLTLNSNGSVTALDGVKGMQIGNTSVTNAGLALETNSRGYLMYINGSALSFWDSTANTERMRIDSSGNLLIGKSTTAFGTQGIALRPSDGASFTRTNASVIDVNRLTSDGEIIGFYKDGTAVGSIGVAGSRPYLSNNINFSIKVDDFANGSFIPANQSGAASDNVSDIGSASARWDDIYATNGTIQTSDRNEKQDIAELDEAERRVAVAAKGLLRKFRWKESVAEKGDEARIHFGIIAQDLQAAFEAEGLDAGRYAMFTHATWTDEETGEERSRMGVRYSELLAFIIAAL